MFHLFPILSSCWQWVLFGASMRLTLRARFAHANLIPSNLSHPRARHFLCLQQQRKYPKTNFVGNKIEPLVFSGPERQSTGMLSSLPLGGAAAELTHKKRSLRQSSRTTPHPSLAPRRLQGEEDQKQKSDSVLQLLTYSPRFRSPRSGCSVRRLSVRTV